MTDLTKGEARMLALKKLEPLIGDDAKLEAGLIVKIATNDQRSLVLTADEVLTTEQTYFFQTLLAERCERKPLSKIQGLKDFWNHQFIVNEHVLDPRADSEVLVEQALLKLPTDRPTRVLDLGTGSACLLLSVLAERPLSTGLGIDCSVNALEVAALNAAKLGLTHRAKFQLGDWAMGLDEKFDLVLCNPPYIDVADMSFMSPEVLNFDPHQALFAEDRGLSDFAKVFSQLHHVLKDGAVSIFEHGYKQREDLVNLAAQFNLKFIASHNDLSGNLRSIVVGCHKLP